MPRWTTVLLAALALAGAGSAHAQTYPSATVKLIVPVPAGGVTDTMARIVAQRLTEAWGQSLAVRSVGELIALAKAEPGTLNYGSYGIGTYAHLSMEDFKQRTGTDIVHIPYRGAAPAVT